MEPALHVGSLVIAHPQTDYQVGQIILYQDGEEIIVHRIVHKSLTCVETKGDANTSGDLGCVKNEHIQGQVVFSVPYFGFIPGYCRMILARLGL